DAHQRIVLGNFECEVVSGALIEGIQARIPTAPGADAEIAPSGFMDDAVTAVFHDKPVIAAGCQGLRHDDVETAVGFAILLNVGNLNPRIEGNARDAERRK